MYVPNRATMPGVYQAPAYYQSLEQQSTSRPAHPPKPPGADLKRVLQYNADYSGCGYWRMLWPDYLLNAYQKVIVTSSTQMIKDKSYYEPLCAVRLQRQAHPGQLQFFESLKKLSQELNFKIIYEIDDIILREDIPDYNKFKFAFTDDAIRSSVDKMMNMADEITVTCDYMKQYYTDKIGNKNISVIPNYPPRLWLDNFYNEDVLSRNYDKNKKKRKRPRILYAGSGAHFDVDNKTNQLDDFTHVRDVIRKTSKKFQWVFMGAVPPPLIDLAREGVIEFHQWRNILELPRFVRDLKVNCMVAPLLDNTFNRCKSDVKFIESCAHGLPVVCQDMITYDRAIHKFKTGDEMIDQLDDVLKDKQTYMKSCRKHYSMTNNMWLDNQDHIQAYQELFTTAHASVDRPTINKLNGIK